MTCTYTEDAELERDFGYFVDMWIQKTGAEMTTCTCSKGVRCAEAERLWRVRAKALEDKTRKGSPLKAMIFIRADRAYSKHINREIR